MKKKVMITIEGDLTLAQAIAEGIAMDIKPKSDTKWEGSKMIDIVGPFVEIRSIIKGPYLTKVLITIKINGKENKYESYSKNSHMFSYDGRDYTLSDFNM